LWNLLIQKPGTASMVPSAFDSCTGTSATPEVPSHPKWVADLKASSWDVWWSHVQAVGTGWMVVQAWHVVKHDTYLHNLLCSYMTRWECTIPLQDLRVLKNGITALTDRMAWLKRPVKTHNDAACVAYTLQTMHPGYTLSDSEKKSLVQCFCKEGLVQDATLLDTVFKSLVQMKRPFTVDDLHALAAPGARDTRTPLCLFQLPSAAFYA